MSMEFTDNQSLGSGSSMLGLLAGSALCKDKDDGKTTLLAAIVFVIVFIIAIIAFAMMFKDRGHDRVSGGTDLAAIIAAKSVGGNEGIDKLAIMQKLEASEDRARQTQTQQEIGCLGKEFMNMGFGLSGQIRDNEKTNLENFAKVENQLGQLTMGMGTLLQERNNEAIIQGVISRLCGTPCFGGR